MKFEKAKDLLTLDYESMDIEKLQKHSVKLLDAWRESKAEYGMQEAVRNGFYVELEDFAGNGFVPRDYWLTSSLLSRLNEVENRLNTLYNS